jgi:hypothetical protein
MPKYETYVTESITAENVFRGAPLAEAELPTFDGAREVLPAPFWEGHEPAIACYWRVWELAFRNLRRPTPASGFVSNFVDTAFNDCHFMWDSAFILMFARYGRNGFDFQRTLDNFHAKQHPDGFICRQDRSIP